MFDNLAYFCGFIDLAVRPGTKIIDEFKIVSTLRNLYFVAGSDIQET